MLKNLVIVQLLKNKQTLIFLSANLIYWKPLEFAEKRTYRSLKRARTGFKIAKQEGNHNKMNSFYQKSPYKSRVTYYNKHRRRTPDPRIYSKHQRCNGSKY